MQSASENRSAQQQDYPTINDSMHQAPETLRPSEVAKPTRSDSTPQQASTNPGDGSKMREETSEVEAPQNQQEPKIPWKDKVLGYAKVTRGKMLGKQETQETGRKILQGEIVPEETRKK